MISESVIGSVYHCITIPLYPTNYAEAAGGEEKAFICLWHDAYQRKVSSGRLGVGFYTWY